MVGLSADQPGNAEKATGRSLGGGPFALQLVLRCVVLGGGFAASEHAASAKAAAAKIMKDAWPLAPARARSLARLGFDQQPVRVIRMHIPLVGPEIDNGLNLVWRAINRLIVSIAQHVGLFRFQDER